MRTWPPSSSAAGDGPLPLTSFPRPGADAQVRRNVQTRGREPFLLTSGRVGGRVEAWQGDQG